MVVLWGLPNGHGFWAWTVYRRVILVDLGLLNIYGILVDLGLLVVLVDLVDLWLLDNLLRYTLGTSMARGRTVGCVKLVLGAGVSTRPGDWAWSTGSGRGQTGGGRLAGRCDGRAGRGIREVGGFVFTFTLRHRFCVLYYGMRVFNDIAGGYQTSA